MESRKPRATGASRQARRAIDGALARDRGRLIGLWSKWNADPSQADAQARFEQALAVSVRERERRAARLPGGEVDPSLPIEIGRASCRERGSSTVATASVAEK